MRFILLMAAAVYGLGAVPAYAQTPCTAGTAGIYGCNNIDLEANVGISTFTTFDGADIWGWTDPDTGREYALMTVMDGTGFVDITVPSSPVYLGKLPTNAGVNFWRDVKTYGYFAFIVADGVGSHGMQVFDLRRLRNVPSPPATFTADEIDTSFGSAHNIALNEATGFAYIVGSSLCSGGLYVIDVRDPFNTSSPACFGSSDVGRGYTHDTQCIVYDGPSAAFAGREICFSSNEAGLSIADVTDKQSIQELSATGYPNVSYAHQGWLSEDRKYFFANDEGDESSFGFNTRTIVWNVEDIEDPFIADEYVGPTASIDHNLYTVGDQVFEANYRSGLRILDASDPENMSESGFFDTFPTSDARGSNGAWSVYPYFRSGTIIVSDIESGLFILSSSLVPPRPGLWGRVLLEAAAVNDTLNVGAAPPLAQPFGAAPFSHAGTETIPGPQVADAAADWVLLTFDDGTTTTQTA
ncbi:MAG: choice-of-anchor B family protein, partial [Bacteroidota bacterium]